MNTIELIDAIATNSHLTGDVSERALNGMMSSISRALKEDKSVFLVHFGRFEIGTILTDEDSGDRNESELKNPTIKAPIFVPEGYLINSINNLENVIDDEITFDQSEFIEWLEKYSWEINTSDEDIYATYIIANDWALIQPTLDAIGVSDYAIQRFLNNVQLKPYQCSFQKKTGIYNKPYYEVCLHISSLPERVSWDFSEHFFNIIDHFQ